MSKKENDGISRRKFLDGLLVVTGADVVGLAGYPVLKFVIPPEQAEPDNLSTTAIETGELSQGEFKIFEFNRKPAILIRTGAGKDDAESYKALTAVCTHLQCTVQYEQDTGQIWGVPAIMLASI
ncbi:MAG: Rieske 2Fe-2S domain-containing protein [Candidatus Electryonea clarkiae]|nr:Rieske 2Fe-2S domain-containing protein [Candidatus Electryonea clarkiae]MDP8288834.1 Rieske 2Fe-2S domain-containing protein [Candidatus Electryonea clarkiae]